MAEGRRGSETRGRSSGRSSSSRGRRPRTPQEKFPKGYFDSEIAIDFIQLRIYTIPQIYRCVETLTKSVPGFNYLLRDLCVCFLHNKGKHVDLSGIIPQFLMQAYESARTLGRRLQRVVQSHEMTRMGKEDRRY